MGDAPMSIEEFVAYCLLAFASLMNSLGIYICL